MKRWRVQAKTRVKGAIGLFSPLLLFTVEADNRDQALKAAFAELGRRELEPLTVEVKESDHGQS